MPHPTALSDSIARIALTPGEPAGIGPDLCLSLLQQPLGMELVAICDPALLEERAALLQIPFHYRLFDPAKPARLTPGELCVLPVPLQKPVTCGRLDPGNARYVLDFLNVMKEETVALFIADELSAALMQDGGNDDFLAIVMPMRT